MALAFALLSPSLRVADVAAALPRPPRRFRWSASLNSAEGAAASLESSDVSWLPNGGSDGDCNGGGGGSDRDLLRLGESMFGSYPSWLVSWPVTFGLLRARPVRDGEEARAVRVAPRRHAGELGSPSRRGVYVCDAFFGFNLLAFGPARSSIRKGRSAESGTRTRRVVVDLPVIGGLLAFMPTAEAVGTGGKSGTTECGCVRFALAQHFDKGGGEKKNASGAATWCSASIETEIAEGYRPAIAGGAPVSLLRKWTYQSTQSIVHAYVMWRFHGRCASYMSSWECSAKH